MMRSVVSRFGSGLFIFGAAACGTSSPPAPAAPTPAPTASASASESPPPPDEAVPASDAGAEPSKEPSSTEPLPDNSTREVRYVVSNGKLEVKIAGVRFVPEAKAVRTGGGWGIKLTVKTESDDEKPHSLLKAKNGPLALAGKVTRKSKTEDIADKREGDDDLQVAPGTPIELTREWPGPSGMKPLASGEKAELEIGIWGLGPDVATRRPLKKFLIVTMVVGKGDPHPIVAPPE